MDRSDHYLLSPHREMLIEHLVAGEIMRYLWLSGVKRLEILKPRVDDGGYDLVLEGNSVVRHVQLNVTFRSSEVGRVTIKTGLAGKPSGCVVAVQFDPDTLELGPFLGSVGHPEFLYLPCTASRSRSIPRATRNESSTSGRNCGPCRRRGSSCSRGFHNTQITCSDG